MESAGRLPNKVDDVGTVLADGAPSILGGAVNQGMLFLPIAKPIVPPTVPPAAAPTMNVTMASR